MEDNNLYDITRSDEEEEEEADDLFGDEDYVISKDDLRTEKNDNGLEKGEKVKKQKINK